MSKKFITGSFAVAAFAFAFVASAAYDFGTTSLKLGSRGEAVKAVQTVVGATPADGVFGQMTKAKVIAWQKANGLVADGIFGAASKAKANGAVVVTPTTPTTPTTPSTPSTLKGAEGDITITKFTSGTETTLGEGKTEKVLGVKVVTDDGSDVSIDTMKVVIDNPTVGAGESTRLERYIEGVKIFMGSKEVGSADVSDFSKDGTKYTKSVSLEDAIVKADSDVKFYVEVEAKSDISSELQNNSWKIAVTSARFTDGMKVVSTETVPIDSPVSTTFGFESSTSNDKITSSTSSNNPEATTLKVSDTGASDEFMVLSFKLKADKDSTDLNVLELPITVQATTEDDIDVINDIFVKVGSETYDDYKITDSTNKTGVYVFEIDEGDFTIEAGESVEVKVYAEFTKEGLSSTYRNGEMVRFTFNGSDMKVENTDGDSVSTSSVTSRTGNWMTLNTSSTVIKNVKTDSTIDNEGKVATYTFTFAVEADGDDVVLNNSTIVARATNGVTPAFSIKKDSGNATGTLGTTYTVADGDESTFTVTYTVDPASNGQTGTYYVTIDSIAGVSVDKTAGPRTITTL